MTSCFQRCYELKCSHSLLQRFAFLIKTHAPGQNLALTPSVAMLLTMTSSMLRWIDQCHGYTVIDTITSYDHDSGIRIWLWFGISALLPRDLWQIASLAQLRKMTPDERVETKWEVFMIMVQSKFSYTVSSCHYIIPFLGEGVVHFLGNQR